MDWPPPPMPWGPPFGPPGYVAGPFPPPWRPMWRGRGNPHPYFMPYMPRFRNGPPPKPEWALRQAERIRAWHKSVKAEQPPPEAPEEDLDPAEHNNEQARPESEEMQDGEGQGIKRAQATTEGNSNTRSRRKGGSTGLAGQRSQRSEETDEEEEACMAPSSDHDDDDL